MDKLGNLQNEHGQELQGIISNYKKDGPSRKTRSYYERRLLQLEQAWSKFEATDNKIRALENPPQDHPYFIKNFYKSIFEIYTQYQEYFTKMKNSFEHDNTDSQDDCHTNLGGATARESLTNVNPEDSKVQRTTGTIPKLPLNPNNEVLSSKAVDEPNDEVCKVLRRQRVMINSLRRSLDGIQFNGAHPRQYFKLKSDMITQHWAQIEQQNYALWELSEDPTAVGYDLTEYTKLEEDVQQALVLLSIQIDQLATSETINQSALKLPKLTLPRFDGDYLKWRQFYDLFTQMVHNQPLSNCQKMWYLKTNLTGEAEKLIRHFSLSEENYNAAWEFIKDRYNNERVLVAALINKLLGQPSLSSDNPSTASIKSLHDTTQECLLALENLGISTASWDPMLLHILIKKLDKTTHILYEQSLANPRDLQTVKNFLLFLEHRFQSLEALGSKGKAVEDHHRRTNSRPLTATAITTPSCLSCKGGHQLFQCQTFLKMAPSSRLNLLRQHNLCINCMRPGHSAAKCSLRGCTKCNKKHNTLVHLKDVEKVLPKPKPLSDKTYTLPLQLKHSLMHISHQVYGQPPKCILYKDRATFYWVQRR